MIWDDVLRALVAALRADTALQALLGADYLKRIKRTSEGELKIPGVTYQVVSSPLEENTESMTVQWDEWGIGYAAIVAIEERLRALMHADGVITVGGIRLWARVLDARDHEDPEEKVAHRSIDIEYTFAKAA